MRAGLLCVAALLLAAAANAAQVRVAGGLIAGKDLPDGSAVYLGVPYAAPPVGALRWQPPQPVIPWRGVRHAVTPPTPCAQLNEGWNAADAAHSAEDCLYLSIHAPRHRPGARLPVLVWIHGGSNRSGSGYGVVDSPIYQHGVVVVGVEFRLGIFGFLSMAALSAQSPHHSSGNYALLDQIAALRWVQRNIASVGGDPRRVTVAGQSSGAVDVGQLLVSPLSRGLFGQAIQESGSPSLPRTLVENEAIGEQLFALDGLPPGPGGLARLRALPTRTLLANMTRLRSPDNAFDALWIAETADGWVVPSTFAGFYGGGIGRARARLIIGNNTQEFVIDSPQAAAGLMSAAFGPQAPHALALYGFQGSRQPQADPVLGTVATQVITDLAFRCVSNDEAQWTETSGQKVWRYQFGVPRPGSHEVSHTAELGYVFGAEPAGATFGSWPPVQRYWANFVRTGDPNGPGLPVWPELGKGRAYMTFTPRGPRPGRELRGPICRLMTDSRRKSLRTPAPVQPLSGPDICEVRTNPMDVLLCESAIPK
ncbi:MAG: carboxylesterase/lipase family protein [Steroidobacteraceae bacterium]